MIIVMKTITTILLISLSAGFISLQAQDRIIKRDGDFIACKVSEIGSEEIFYSLAEYNFAVRFSIFKSEVEKIIFENGRELVIDHAEAARA